MPKVSVIIPAYNEEENILDCMVAFENQTFTDFDLHLFDDASTDQTPKIIQDFQKRSKVSLHFHQGGKMGPARARNFIAGQTEAEILAFTDADCIVDQFWLESLISGFDRRPDVASVGGPHLAPFHSSAFQQVVEKFFQITSPWVDFYKSEKTLEREVPHNPLCNVAYRKNIFRDLKGFREDLFPGEDIEFDLRLRERGEKILFCPEAVVYHHRPKNLAELRALLYKYGRAQGQLIRTRGVERPIQAIGLVTLASGILALAGLIFYSPLTLLSLFIIAFAITRIQTPWTFLLQTPLWLAGLAKGLLKPLSQK